MLGSVFGLKGMLLAGGIALTAGGLAGWKVRDSFCDSAQAKAELANAQANIRALNHRIATMSTLADKHQKRVDADAIADRANEESVSETPKNTSACLHRDVARRLRSIK